MRAPVCRALMLALCTASSGCYIAHERSRAVDAADDGPAPDAEFVADVVAAPDAWLSRDVGPPTDRGPCQRFRETTWGTPCTAEIEAECQRRATIEANGRYAYTRCVTQGSQSFCSPGDICPVSALSCLCTRTRQCAYGIEVCVSDTADGPRECLPLCAP